MPCCLSKRVAHVAAAGFLLKGERKHIGLKSSVDSGIASTTTDSVNEDFDNIPQDHGPKGTRSKGTPCESPPDKTSAKGTPSEEIHYERTAYEGTSSKETAYEREPSEETTYEGIAYEGTPSETYEGIAYDGTPSNVTPTTETPTNEAAGEQPEIGKGKDTEVKLRRRVSNIFQGVRKNRFSRSSRDSGVASSATDSLSLDWMGDDDSDWDNDDFSDDSDFDDDFYEDFKERVSVMRVDERLTEDMTCKIAVFMLQTEREYVLQLTKLVKLLFGLAGVAKKHKGSDSEGVLNKMAKSAGAILQFHDNFFLPSLKTRLAEWKSRHQLGDIMKAHAPYFKLYRAYTLPFEQVIPVITAWKRESKKFSSLIKDINKLPECDKISFQNCMWYPIKRLQTMQFFLAAYLKNISENSEERNDIIEALGLLCEAKDYPQKATRKRSMRKVKHDIRELRSFTPPPPISEAEHVEESTTEVHPEDTIIPKDKVQRIILELLTTERSYVRKLRLLQKIEERFRNENTLSEDTIKGIFSKLESILLFHAEHLLPQIEERAVNWETNKRIGDVLKKNAPFLKIYAEYIQNYEHAKHQIETWKKRSSKFASVLVEIRESTESGGIPLDGHLLEPVQRVPRYELLIKEYLKNISKDCEDRNDAEGALKLVKEAASHSNTFLKKMDKFKKTYDVYQTLKGTKFDFSVPDRELLKEGPITLITPGTCEKQRKIIYLFSDVIILCSDVLFGKSNVSSEIELSDLKISKGENIVVPDTFVIMGTSTTVELQNIEDGNTDWYKEITSVLQEMVKRKMSTVSDSELPSSPSDMEDRVLSTPTEISKEEIGKRAPRLKPFQTATKCMRCRTRFSSTMKKYNCKGCGFVICSKCSREAKMEYRNMKSARACYECFMLLRHDSSSDSSDDDTVFRPDVMGDDSSF